MHSFSFILKYPLTLLSLLSAHELAFEAIRRELIHTFHHLPIILMILKRHLQISSPIKCLSFPDYLEISVLQVTPFSWNVSFSSYFIIIGLKDGTVFSILNLKTKYGPPKVAYKSAWSKFNVIIPKSKLKWILQIISSSKIKTVRLWKLFITHLIPLVHVLHYIHIPVNFCIN